MADAPKPAAKGKKEEKKKQEPSKRLLYKIEGNKVVRTRKSCPKCGGGVFLAEHKDRTSCGNCGYTEFKRRENAPAKAA
jgi:ubiquitin-small subunit ribosomal protein S27Ae